MTTFVFDWSWISELGDTLNESTVVKQGSGVVFSFRQPYGGAISSSDISSFANSVSQNLQTIRNEWRAYTRPILNSLPAGGSDARWSTSAGKGLPDKIDCFAYGIQGSTLFAFNDANATKADGRYWKTDELRPKTISEVLEDLYSQITNISSTVSTSTTVDLDPLWAAIGEDYRNSSRVGSVGSLDTRMGTVETYISQLNTDIYEPLTYTYGIGNPIPYSIAHMLDAILKIHNISGGWGSDPTSVDHSGVVAGTHTHPLTDVLPPPSNSLTQSRTGPYTSIYNEVLRLRWEIERTRGSASWFSDVTSPIVGSPVATLGLHVNYTGSGTASTSNPHGINYVDTGSETVFTAIRSYTGMSSNADSSPTYSSTNYVVQGSSLETAIGVLDDTLAGVGGTTVVRKDYSYDRSGLSETDRAATAITVTHNIGRKPIVEVLDVSPTYENYWGIYVAPAIDIQIVHVDVNSFQIWTEAASVEVIVIG